MGKLSFLIHREPYDKTCTYKATKFISTSHTRLLYIIIIYNYNNINHSYHNI